MWQELHGARLHPSKHGIRGSGDSGKVHWAEGLATPSGRTYQGQTEAAFSQPLCRYPKAGAIEVEKLEAVVPLVGEDQEGIPGGG